MSSTELPELPDRYVLSHRLGGGWNKSVYLAMDSTLERPVAVAAYSSLNGTRDALLREARAMARIGDLPHLVSIYDVIEAPAGTAAGLYVISQYLPGGSLALRLRGAVDTPAIVRLGLQLAKALEALHARGVTHGDLTSANVLLDAEGVAHVADFGLSNLALGGPDDGMPRRRTTFEGTLAYMAPERAWGSPPSTAADIYGLGCILYEAATGLPPHASLDPSEVLNAKSEGPAPRVTESNPAVPEALGDLITSTLAPDPSVRPRAAGDIRAALEGLARASFLVADPSTRARRTRGPAELVCRDREMAAIGQTLRDAHDQALPQSLLLSGDAGSGKSRLLRSIAEQTQQRGGTVTLGHTRSDTPTAFQPFLDALLPLAPRIPELPESEAGVVRSFLRLGDAGRGVLGATAASDPHATRGAFLHASALDRRSMFVGLLRALCRLAVERPLTILLDDFEGADPDSIELFEFLLRGTETIRDDVASEAGSRLLLVASFRPLGASKMLAETLDRLLHETGVAPFRLEPFDEAATYAFLSAAGLPRPATRLVREMRAATNGNPLFLLQAIDSLRDSGALSVRNGTTTLRHGHTVELPRTLAGAILERTKAVSAPCRRLLTIASFIGDRFALNQLTAVAGTKEDALLDLIEEAMGHDLVAEEVDAFRFTHPLIRQALYGRPSHARRRRIHAQIAARLVQIHADDLDRAIGEIAHHLVRAGAAADPAQTLTYAAEAARQAVDAYAWNEAADLYMAAISAAEKVGRLSKAAEAELRRRAAEVHRQVADTGLSLEQYEAAAVKFEEAGDAYGRAEALEGKLATEIAQGTLGQVHDTEPLEEALRALDPGETLLRARVLATLALAHWAKQEPLEAAGRARTALLLADEADDARLGSDIRCQLGFAELQQLQPDRALAMLESALVDARRVGDAVREEAALQRVPIVLQLLGRLGEARRVVGEADRLNRLVHSPSNLSLTLANRTQLAALEGDVEAAKRHAAECTDVMRRAHYGWSGLIALPALASAHALVGERAEAEAAIARVLEPGLLFDDPSFFAESISRYRSLIEAYGGADLHADFVVDLSPFEPGPLGLDFAFVTPLCVEVEIAWFSGADSISTSAERALGLAHRRGMVFSTAWPFLIPRVRGMAATLERRWDDAECRFLEAIQIADEQHVVPERGRSRMDYATLLLRREPNPRPDAAREFLREATSFFREARMTGFERRAVRVADSAGITL